ncbi:hypothetical protein HMPREF0972_00798 [Actinomyces sp. oral taxon 848 str. F0332]|nr:hypothetical protein HMPREF0972_00798 [Actinomyces sp. oral taxon 848 str. F0332]
MYVPARRSNIRGLGTPRIRRRASPRRDAQAAGSAHRVFPTCQA